MADDEIRLGIKLEADRGGARQAAEDLERVNREIDELKDQFRRGKTDVSSFTRELTELQSESRKLARALDELEEPRKLDVRTDAFDRVSRDVSLAGDVESNLRTIGGAVGAFGGTGAERVISQASEIPAVIEALPRLKAAAEGLPATLSAFASSMGATGLAAGAAAAAVGTFIVVLQQLRKASDAAQQTFKNQISVQTDAIELAATQSREQLLQLKREAEVQIAVAEAQNEVSQRVLGELEQSFEESFSFIEKQVIRFNTTLGTSREGTFGAALIAARESANEASDSLENMETNLGAINRAIELIDTGQAIDGGQRAQEADQSSDIVQEAEKAIAQAREESARITEQTAQDTVQALQQGSRAAREARREMEVGAIGVSFDTPFFGGGDTAGGARSEREQDRERVIEEQQQLRQDLIDLRQDMAEDRKQAQIDLHRDLAKIDRDFADDRADALREGQFLALDDVNRAEKRAERERQIRAREQQQDITRRANEQRRDILEQVQKTTQERLRIETSGQQRELEAKRQFWSVAVGMAQSAALAITDISRSQRARLRSARTITEEQSRSRNLFENAPVSR